MRLIPRTLDQIDSPIGATYGLLAKREGDRRGLLDLAQAAPAYPPAPEVARRVAEVAQAPGGNAYVAIAGLEALRQAFALELSDAYGGFIETGNVLITAGCNQAFCMATSTLAAAGDEVIVPLPFYFNHDMWLRLEGMVPVYVEPGPDWTPDPDAARAAITPRTRAIILVTPGNPTGVTVDPPTIARFAAVAAEAGIALIIDETYRTFRPGTASPPHALFADPAWSDSVISLHSFSKDLALPGYRVGAMIASRAVIREAMKLLDCVAICAPRIGQEAALAGLREAGAWRRERSREVARKLAAFEAAMACRPGGFELVTSGAYFGWIRHPFQDRSTPEVVEDLILKHDTLVIPGTAFLPDDRRMIRASVANLELEAIGEFTDRLVTLGR